MAKTINLIIPKAVVTSVFTNKDKGVQYVKFSSPAGEFSLSSKLPNHDFDMYTEENRTDYNFEVTGRLFGGNQQSLAIQKINHIGTPKKQ